MTLLDSRLVGEAFRLYTDTCYENTPRNTPGNTSLQKQSQWVYLNTDFAHKKPPKQSQFF